MSALLNDLLQTAKPLPWNKALPQLVAKVANARRTAPDELRAAILRQALVDNPEDSATNDHVAFDSSPQEKDTVLDTAWSSSLSDDEFAELTLKAAKATKDRRLKDHKVFISRVWNTLKQQYPNMNLSLEDFKQRLIKLNQQRKLDLSRADLAYALDPENVSTSEISHLNNTFHFIRLD